MDNIIGSHCISTREAPFTEKQHSRLGKVLDVEALSVHVEWVDASGWKTRCWMPRSWIHVSGDADAQ